MEDPSHTADRAALLEYVLEIPTVAPTVVWPIADRSAVDAAQIAGHPIDLDKVDVAEVLRCIKADEAVDLTGAVARLNPADRLKRWLPALCAVREFQPALTEAELTAMAYELLLCCTVLKGSTPLQPADEELMEAHIRVGCGYSMKRHRALVRQLQVLGADEAAAASLGEPSTVQPLRYRWLLLRNTSPTRETHAEFYGWCRRQLVFLLVSLLLHLRGTADPARRWRLPDHDYELSAEEVEEQLIDAFCGPLRELGSIDTAIYYSTDRYDDAVSALAPHVDALLEQLERVRLEERGGGSGEHSSVGLSVAAPFSLMLYEVLLGVVFVSDELAEEGDGGKHPEADALVSLYHRCCWPALGLRGFEHGLAMAAVGYGRFITREEGYGSARLGLLRSLTFELESLDAPSLIVRLEQDGPTGIRWQKGSGSSGDGPEEGNLLIDAVTDGSPASQQLRQLGGIAGGAGRKLMLLRVNGEAVAGKSRGEVLEEINADGRSERMPLELAFKPPPSRSSAGSSMSFSGAESPLSRDAGGLVCGVPVWLPCTGGDPTAARSLASELLKPLNDTCREQLSDCCGLFDNEAGAVTAAGEQEATVQAMAALVSAASRLRGEELTDAEKDAGELIKASLSAYCGSLADISQLQKGDSNEVLRLTLGLQSFVSSGGFAAFANACLPTVQHCMTGLKGRGVLEAYLALGSELHGWVENALFPDDEAYSDDGDDDRGGGGGGGRGSRSSGALDDASLNMINALILLEETLEQTYKQHVSDRVQPAFGEKTIAELVEAPITSWVEARCADWERQLEKILQIETWEPRATTGKGRSDSVNDLMRMLVTPIRKFEESGLSSAASEAVRGRFVQAVAETVQSYVQQVATAAASDGTGALRLPALPESQQPVGERLKRKDATKQNAELRLGRQDFTEAEMAAASVLSDASFGALALRLNSLEFLCEALRHQLVPVFERAGSSALGEVVLKFTTRSIAELSELIGGKVIWLDQREGLLQNLYRTDAAAIDRCNKDIDKRGGKKTVGDDGEISCIPPQRILSAGATDVLDGINNALSELEALLSATIRPVVMDAIFKKFLDLYAHILTNFDVERILCVEDALSLVGSSTFEQDLVRRGAMLR